MMKKGTKQFIKVEGAEGTSSRITFRRNLLKRAEIKGINLSELTLHAGLGTLKPFEAGDSSCLKWIQKDYLFQNKSINVINARVLVKKYAIGSTCIRALESSVSTDLKLKP